MKIDIKKFIPAFVIVFAVAVLFFLSLFMYQKKGYGKRFVFIFPSVEENQYVLETRYLKENPLKDYLSYFADELVLGSGLERTKYLFTPGTKILSCLERNKIVYIDLSADIINMGHNVIQIKDGVELLQKNILKNFPNVQEVRVFVDGKYAFE